MPWQRVWFDFKTVLLYHLQGRVGHEVGKMCLKTAPAMVTQTLKFMFLLEKSQPSKTQKESQKLIPFIIKVTSTLHAFFFIILECRVWQCFRHKLPSWPMGPAQASKTWVTLSTVQPSLAKKSSKSCMGLLFGQTKRNPREEREFL